nr:hypothetical protein [Tanacetum cinerariifolium]
MIIKKDSEIVKAKLERKSLALKAKKESSDEECLTFGSEDEEYAMMVRDFKKFFKRRGDRKYFSCDNPNHLIGECTKPPKDKKQRVFVEGSWSDNDEEDDEKVKDETCLVDQASNEVCSDSSYFSDENSSTDDLALDSEYDKLCKMSLKIITKKKRLKATRSSLENELRELKEKLSTLEKNKGVDLECTNCQLLKIKNEKLKEEALKLTKFEKSTHCLNEMLSNKKPSDDKLGPGFKSRGWNLFIKQAHISRQAIKRGPITLRRMEARDPRLLQYSKAYIILYKHTRRIKESLNMTFDETPPPYKTSPLVDDDLDEEEAFKVTEKKNIENDIDDETLEIEEIVNIKESRNHPLENVIGNLNQRTLRSQAQNQNIIFGSTCQDMCDEFAKIMHDEFEMSMMGELNFFLGLQIKQMEGGIFLNQSKYIKEILKRFGLEDSKPIKNSMSFDAKLIKDEECELVDSTKYLGMIGSLLYLTESRPDIMFSVCLCAHFQEAPKTSHLKEVKRIFRYINGTTHLGLWYPKGTDIKTVVYADSDHAGDYMDRKSTSGICMFMGCCLTSWFLKKQPALAISTTKAEYISARKACQQALWMKQALIDYDIRIKNVPIMCDNKGAIDLSKNPLQHSRTKHIEIHHHFLRNNVHKGHISIEKVSSVDNIIKILTKPLKLESFNYLRFGLGMMEHIS